MASRHIGSVYIRVVPDTKDFRRDTQRAFDRMEPFKVPVEVEIDTADMQRRYDQAMRELERRSKPVDIDVTPNTDGFEKDLDEGVEKATSRKDFTVKVSADYDGVLEALDTMQRELAALERTREIKFDLDRDSIQDAMRRLEDELASGEDELGNALTAQMRIRPDEQGYRQVIRQIEEIRRMQQRPIEMEIQLDEDGLHEQWDKAHQELARLQNQRPLLPEKVMIEYDATNRDSIDAQIAELENRLRGLQSDKITIPVDMDQSSIEAALAELHSRRRDVNLHPRVNPFALGMVEGQLATAARDRWVNLRPRIARSFLRDIEGAFMAIAGLNSIRALVNQIRDIALNFDEWAFSVGTVSAAIGSLASVATVGLGAVLSIAADTLQVFQGIAAAPTLLLSGANALQTWTAIWQDFDAALMGIPGVLEEMPPAAQRAVGAIEDLNESVNQTVQQNFWGQMTDEVERFNEAIGPHIVMSMGETARVMGRVVSNMLDYTELLVEGGSLDEFIRNNTHSMELFGNAAERGFRALMTMGIQGSQYLPALGRYVDDLAARFEAFINESVRTGRFDMWIMNAIRSLQSMGQAIGATWDILAGFTKAFESIGGPGLHEMADGLERIADWVNSSGTQRALRDMFSAAVEGASAFGQGVGDLISALWDYRDAVNEAMVVTGQLGGEFLTAIANVDPTVLFRGFFDMMDGLRDFVRVAQPGFESIANIFGRLGSIGGEVAREVAHGMNLTMAAIDGFIARIEGPLIDAIHPLTRVFEDIAALGTGPLFVMAEALGAILTIFNQLPGPIQNIITLLTILGRTGFLAGFQRGMQNMIRGTDTARQSVFRFTSDVERRTGRMRDRVAANMAATGAAINRTFTGSAAIGSVNTFASQVETRLGQMRTRVGTIMSRVGASMRRGLGGLAGALGGPWGIGLTTAIGLLSSFAGEQAEAEAATERLTDALIHQGEAGLQQAAFAEFRTELEAYARAGGDVEYIMSEVLAGRGDQVADALLKGAGAMGEFNRETSIHTSLSGRMSRAMMGAGDESREFLGAANDLGKALQGSSGWMEVARANANLYEGDLGNAAGATDDLVGALDGAPPQMEALATAMGMVADQAANADQRSAALHQTLKLLNGEELSADELMRSAVDAFNNTMSQVERIANDTEFDWSNVFTEDGAIDYTVEGNQIKGMVDDFQRSFTDRLTANRIKLEDEGIDYSQDDFDAFVEGLEGEWTELGETLIDELNLTGEAAEKFRAMWEENMVFDPVDIEISFDNENNVERAKKDFTELQDLGLEMDQSEWVASLDVNGDNAITDVEYVQGLAKTFGELHAEAKLSADGDADAVIEAAWDRGIAWDGEDFIAAVDADGEPNRAAFEAAWEAGRTWHDGRFVSEVDAITDPATEALADTINEAEGLWVDGEFIAKLDADGHPTEEMVAYARSLGLEWNGSEFVSVVDADGEGADSEITKRREQALEYQTTYEALLDAGLLPSAAGAFVDAIASAEEYEGDYQAVLDALQSEEGKQELIEFVEGLEEIPESTRSEIIAAIEGDELVDDLQTALDQLDETTASPSVEVDEERVSGAGAAFGQMQDVLDELDLTEAEPKVDADTEDADNKIDNTKTSAQQLGLINPMVSLGIMGDNHVINRATDAKDAADQVDGSFISTLLTTGAPSVITAAMAAFGADSLVDDSFLSTLLTTGSGSVITAAMAAFGADSLVDDSFLSVLLSTGSGGVVASAMAAFGASDMVADFFQAIFGETGASHVMGQAGGVQGSISSINMNPVVRFGGSILSSFTSAVSRVRNAVAGIATGVAGALSRDGSMTGTRFKPEHMPLLSVKAFGRGGFENHSAQIAYSTPSTPIRIWAEPETGGEAYIPLSPAKRRRSMGIFEEVGKQFGVFGDGGIEGGVITRTEYGRGGDVYNIRIEGGNVGVKDLVNEVTHQRRRRDREF